MQPLARADAVTGAALTAAQVTSLIRDSTLEVAAGLELVDLGLNVLADLTGDFPGGSVSRSNYATLHGTATLYVATELDWGTALLRPYMTLSDGTITARFNLGVYLTSSPKTEAGDSPVTHDVRAYDILHWLGGPVGETYTVEAGTGYLAAVETILTTNGILAYQIDQAAAASVLPSPRSWVFSDGATWLNIINDLLGAVGYQGIWSDWDGRLRVQPYEVPSDRAVEWVYDDDPLSSMIAPKRAVIRDWFDTPNKWTFYWSQDPATAPPVDGAGLYVYENKLYGPTSQAARGRVIAAKPERVDAVDQAALVAAATQRIDAVLRLASTYELDTSPNPLSWHFDKYTVADPGLGPIADVQGVSWTLPLDGSDMRHVWSLL